MRRLTLWALACGGLGLFIYGFALLFLGSAAVLAQDNVQVDLEDAEYVGASECGDYHRDVERPHDETAHALTLQEIGRDEELILGDFEQGADVRTVLFPGDDEPRPFVADDIEFAVGSGRNVQRYLYEAEDDFMVLPAQWNVSAQAWEPYTLADEWPGEAYAFGPNCAGCHTTGLSTRRFNWEDPGVQCEACHGPASLHIEAVDDDEDPEVIRASIVISPDPQICGQCHSQGTEPENNLPYPAEYRPGQNNLLDEDIFTLVAPDDEAHWYASGHARDKYMQFNESLVSAHSGALTSMQESEFADDNCLQCHSGDFRWNEAFIDFFDEEGLDGDEPDRIRLNDAQFGITCANCHDSHLEDEFITPFADDTYALCTDCHTSPSEGDSPDGDLIHHPAREMFEGAEMVSEVEPVPGAHFSAEDGPRCATCHMPEVPVEGAGARASHRWTPILPGTAEELQDSCTTCHTEFVDVEGMQQLVADIQASTQSRLEAAQSAMTDASPEWVSAALQFVEGDGSQGIHNVTYTDALLKAAETELGLAPTPIAEPDLSALINTTPPPDTVIQTEAFTGEVGGGLTMPSIILLAIFALIIGIAGFAFFRGTR